MISSIRRLSKNSAEWTEQQKLVELLREVYGQHRCASSKIITTAQKNDDGSQINDCLGHPNGSLVDNIEDVDAMVGWLAEFARPHGFAISETQFQVFILNASRRLFSDRFLTSSFRPAFYTNLGYNWVNNNGPDGKNLRTEESQRTYGRSVAIKARASKNGSRTARRTRTGRKCFRSLDPGPRRILLARLEAAARRRSGLILQKQLGKLARRGARLGVLLRRKSSRNNQI